MNNDNALTRPATGALLWLVLIVSAAVNAAGPLVGLDFAVRTAAGGVVIVAIALLITRHVRRRRRN